ncbi:MAG TPA: TonB family protein [Terriglobia bacterium]|nr:TonB family protein [Terriglobia bacterium]
MGSTKVQGETGQTEAGGNGRPVSSSASSGYQITIVDSTFPLVSLVRQIRAAWRDPKVTVPPEYYKGEVALPITEMRPWFRDLPAIFHALLEKPTDEIGIYNHRQEKWHLLLAGIGTVLGIVGGWLTREWALIILLAAGGYAVGKLAGIFIFKKKEYPPDVFRDYEQEPASWVNSLLVHALMVTALVLPFIISKWMQPVQAKGPNKEVSVDISPYLPELTASSKKAGGGGGGGDRSPTPASKGAIPKFSKVQFAPPMAVIPNPAPKLTADPTLLGPPEMKLPEMAQNVPWGDPHGVNGPASNGPGTGGGIGSGTGTGIGSGNGGGLGPGEGGGTGGGVYSVGGNVSAPIAIFKPEPPYSEEARKAKWQGTVVLWIIVDAQGNVSDVRVARPLGLGLDEKAVETVKTWKFKPAMRGGSPVAVRVSVEVTFRLF